MNYRAPAKSFVKHRNKPWKVRWGDRARPSSAFFATEGEADDKIAALEGDLSSFGTEGLVSNRDRLALMQARELLQGRDLIEVLRRGLEGLPPQDPVQDKRISLAETVERFHRFNDGQGLRPKTLLFYEEQLRILVGSFPESKLAEVDRPGLLRVIKNLDGKPASKKCLRAAVRRLFNWAYRCDPPLLEQNPVARGLPLDLPKQDTAVEFLTLDQVRAVLRGADRELRGTLAVQFFTGLRREELKRMDWRSIDRAGRRISIAARESKTRKGDDLEKLPPVLWTWLKEYGQPEGRILCPNYDKRLRKAFAGAGMTAWPQSGARHTFATYHYAAFRDSARTIAIMRHESGLGMFLRHYKGTGVTQAQGREFLAITPASLVQQTVHQLP